MKPARLFLSAITLALTLLFACGGVFATAGQKKVAVEPPEAISKVTAVNPANMQVTILFKGTTTETAKLPRTYTLDEISTVTINNVAARFADIRPGMIVQGATERDAHTLDNITLEGSGSYNTPAPAAAKPKPKSAAGA